MAVNTGAETILADLRPLEDQPTNGSLQMLIQRTQVFEYIGMRRPENERKLTFFFMEMSFEQGHQPEENYIGHGFENSKYQRI